MQVWYSSMWSGLISQKQHFCNMMSFYETSIKDSTFTWEFQLYISEALLFLTGYILLWYSSATGTLHILFPKRHIYVSTCVWFQCQPKKLQRFEKNSPRKRFSTEILVMKKKTDETGESRHREPTMLLAIRLCPGKHKAVLIKSLPYTLGPWNHHFSGEVAPRNVN